MGIVYNTYVIVLFFSLSLYLLSYLVFLILFSPMCILSAHNEVIKTRSFDLSLFLLHLYAFLLFPFGVASILTTASSTIINEQKTRK